MTPSASAFLFNSEFDDFLFAPIGEDKNGKLLSILSALARSDLDPWQEAAELAELPGEPATQRLASLIAALPDGSMAHPAPGTAAARLITLLPLRTRSIIRSRETSLDAGEMMKFRAAAIYASVISIVLISLAISSLLVPAHGDNPHSMSSCIVQAPQPSFDHWRGTELGLPEAL
jgi:hypothetical protein